MSTHKQTKLWDWTVEGSPKVTEGQPKIFACSINIGELDRSGNFSQIDLWECDVRRTISFCINKLQVSCWRKLCGRFQMLCNGFVECELFCFQLLSITCEIILTFWTYVLVWMLSSLFYEISTMSNECGS